MERGVIFLVSAAFIAVAACILFFVSVVTFQGAMISDLMQTVDSNSAIIDDLNSRAFVSCGDSYFVSPSGKIYLSARAQADENGDVSIMLTNRRKDNLIVTNLREVYVEQDGTEFEADYKDSPTFGGAGGTGSCMEALTSGEFMTCVSSGYREEVLAARESGSGALIIKYMKADVNAEPSRVLAEDICVKL